MIRTSMQKDKPVVSITSARAFVIKPPKHASHRKTPNAPKETLYRASIGLQRSESPESAAQWFELTSQNRGKFFPIPLTVRRGENIVQVDANIMLVAIETRDKQVLLLDHEGNMLTLAQGEPVRMGSSNYWLVLERAASEQVDAFKRPFQTAAEAKFLRLHASDDWKEKYRGQ